MDIFIFVVGLTLAAASVFLIKDYVRFLLGVYSVPAKVVSIQQVFVPCVPQNALDPYVKNGFYPVVEYQSESGPVTFTVIDPATSGRFHVGDCVGLKVAKTRRRQRRSSKSISILVFSQLLLFACLISAAIFSSFELSTIKIVLASVVLALCFAILILYTRDQDAQGINDFEHSRFGCPQLCLFEPTACSKWRNAWMDKRQQLKIRSSQAFGAFCMMVAGVLFVLAMKPVLHLTLLQV
ncbi:MAG: hypothetical protein C9356_09030 [Oleiphilus sp.]|nr:MAG: hypothetical protein C9356_09030 [Oleiphilus sp.]